MDFYPILVVGNKKAFIAFFMNQNLPHDSLHAVVVHQVDVVGDLNVGRETRTVRLQVRDEYKYRRA